MRAVTSNAKNYQFASSGPYYVERGGRPRVSRASVQFFLDWIDAAEARIRELPDLDEPTRDEAASRAGVGAASSSRTCWRRPMRSDVRGMPNVRASSARKLR